MMGRNAAGESFLRAYLQYASPNERIFYLTKSQDEQHIIAAAKQYTTDTKPRLEFITSISDISNRGLYVPDPVIGELSYRRQLFTDSAWSLCGICHTTSSAHAMDSITDWITSPVQPWDAVICTSNAVKNNVESILQAQIEALKERLGITRTILPRLPVIPLGVHTSDFTFTEQQRLNARERIGADQDSLVVLYVGRLSFHAKAHPLPMYQALEKATIDTGKNIILIECGWHANQEIEKAFVQGAHYACPSIQVITLDGRLASNRETAWACADIFCSLSDNIQETFGISPVEAMAAGLPVVVSDWNGYRDSVRDGLDGFRIPTLAPKPGLAGDLAHRHALGIDSYDMYCGHSSSLVAVHIQKLTKAFTDLFNYPELRQKMGESGMLRAQQNYDWQMIIPIYEELWTEQNKIRIAETNKKKLVIQTNSSQPKPAWPARLDPTIGFANYPTTHLDLNTELRLTVPTAEAALQKIEEYKKLAMVNYASYIFPVNEEIKIVLTEAEKRFPETINGSALVSNIRINRKPYVLRSLAWLCKLGIFEFN
jgi:glycosyltransferase involved in cell wall biosynthesis